MFMCSLTQDSYSLTLYALPVAKLTDLPAAVDTGTNMPAAAGWNWVVNMAHYIESLTPIAVAEYRGTSKAWAGAFVPASAAAFPCSGGSGGAGRLGWQQRFRRRCRQGRLRWFGRFEWRGGRGRCQRRCWCRWFQRCGADVPQVSGS